MEIEYIEDMKTLLDTLNRNEVIVWAYGSTGVQFINLMRYTGRANICAIVQESKSTVNNFLCDIPVLYLRIMPHYRDSATFIVAAPANKNAVYHKKLADYGCKTIYCLTDEVHKTVTETIRKFQSDGSTMSWFMNYFVGRLKQVEYRFSMQNEICKVNAAAFESYRNCYQGKDLVIVGTGATASDYKPNPDAIHIALDGACRHDDIKFNYLFAHNISAGGVDIEKFFDRITDRIFIGKFASLSAPDEYSEQIILSNDKVARYFAYDNLPTQLIYQDITNHPLAYFGGVFGAALQFAAFTLPKTIRLVGCELPDDAAQAFKKVGYTRLKMIMDKWYPAVKIISVDPIELKGLFGDEFSQKAATEK